MNDTNTLVDREPLRAPSWLDKLKLPQLERWGWPDAYEEAILDAHFQLRQSGK